MIGADFPDVMGLDQAGKRPPANRVNARSRLMTDNRPNQPCHASLVRNNDLQAYSSAEGSLPQKDADAAATICRKFRRGDAHPVRWQEDRQAGTHLLLGDAVQSAEAAASTYWGGPLPPSRSNHTDG